MDDVHSKAMLYQLIIAQLQADGFISAAASVALSTNALPFPAGSGKVGTKLADIVKKSLQTEGLDGTMAAGNELLKSLDLEDKSMRGTPVMLQECRLSVPHNSPIKVARFSPDGEYVATGTVVLMLPVFSCFI